MDTKACQQGVVGELTLAGSSSMLVTMALQVGKHRGVWQPISQSRRAKCNNKTSCEKKKKKKKETKEEVSVCEGLLFSSQFGNIQKQLHRLVSFGIILKMGSKVSTTAVGAHASPVTHGGVTMATERYRYSSGSGRSCITSYPRRGHDGDGKVSVLL